MATPADFNAYFPAKIGLQVVFCSGLFCSTPLFVFRLCKLHFPRKKLDPDSFLLGTFFRITMSVVFLFPPICFKNSTYGAVGRIFGKKVKLRKLKSFPKLFVTKWQAAARG